MNLFEASYNVLNQLYQVISQVDREDYSKSLINLNGSTIGQHVRHTVEFFVCLTEGLESGVVNYDLRKRDIKIENDPEFAMKKIEETIQTLKECPSHAIVTLEGSYSETSENLTFSINSSLERELAYNIEHAVHHMAIIKIGLVETSPALEVPANFGIAVSTVRYQN